MSDAEQRRERGFGRMTKRSGKEERTRDKTPGDEPIAFTLGRTYQLNRG